MFSNPSSRGGKAAALHGRTLTLIDDTTNVIANSSSIIIGSGASYVNVTATGITIANTGNTITIVPPTTAQKAGSYYLKADGVWTSVSAGGSSTRIYQQYSATALQTSFTVTAGYTVGTLDVFYNGVHLANDEYTATNGTTVVLGAGAELGTVVEIEGYQAVSSFNPVAGGANTQVQYNDSTVISGSAGFTFNNTTNNATIANTLTAGITGIVNSTTVSTTGFTANTLGAYANSVVNAASLTVGTNFVANSTAMAVGANNIINTTAIAAGNAYFTGLVNAASYNVGTSSIVNSTIVVSGGSILSANVGVSACTGTAYTLLSSDSGKIVTMNNAGAMTVTVPAGLPIGFRTQVMRKGAGTCTISNTAQTGAILQSRTGAFAITAQWASASIFEESANNYVVDGFI